MPTITRNRLLGLALAASLLAAPATARATDAPANEIPVELVGGFQLGPNDYGRPVTLIASMLRVTPDVFRQAFSGVTPAVNGEPSPAQAQANKTALLRVLAPYGVTNEKLDAVANYYRFNPSRGESWPHRPAAAAALVQDGRVTGFRVTTPGAGYAYPPTVVVPDFPGVSATATLSYTTAFDTNGSLAAITLAPTGASAAASPASPPDATRATTDARPPLAEQPPVDRPPSCLESSSGA